MVSLEDVHSAFVDKVISLDACMLMLSDVGLWGNKRAVVSGFTGLLWLDDKYGIVDWRKLEPFGSEDLFKGNYILINDTHDSFDSVIGMKSDSMNRARVEVFNGVVKVSVGKGCVGDRLNKILKFMKLCGLGSDKLEVVWDADWDAV